MKKILIAVLFSLLFASCWEIHLVQIGQSPAEVQNYLVRKPEDIAQRGEYKFVFYDPPGHGGDYVFIFENDSLIMFGPESDLPDPDEIDKLKD